MRVELPLQQSVLPLIKDNEGLFRCLRWTVLYALATRKHIKEYIIKKYEENRIEYYKAFKESEFGSQEQDFSLFASGTHDIFIKTAGIFALAEKDCQYSNLFELIQKGFKFAWNYVKLHKEVNIIYLYDELTNNNKFNEEEVDMQIAIVYFLCIKKGQDIILDYKRNKGYPKKMVEIIFMGIFEQLKDNYILFFRPIEGKVLLPFSPKRKQLEEKWNVTKDLQKNLHQYINFIREKEASSYFPEVSYLELSKQEWENLRKEVSEKVSLEGKTRIWGILSDWLDQLGIKSENLYEQFTVSYSHFEKVFSFLELFIQHSYIHEEEEDLMISALLIISALTEDYKFTKQKYFSQHIEEWEYQLQKTEREWRSLLQQKELEWKTYEAKTKQIQLNQEQEIQYFKLEAKSLEKKVRQLEADLKKQQQFNKELEALKAFVISQGIEETHENNTFEEKVSWLKEKHITLIGGHPNWQNKLKEIFPHFTIVDVADLHRDLSFVNYADAVFINTSFLSHSLYWKVMNLMHQNDIPLYYIERSTNIERTVTCMFEDLQPSLV